MKKTKSKYEKNLKRKPSLSKFTFNDIEYVNFTTHEITIYYTNNIGERKTLSIPPSGIEARIAYTKEPGGLLSDVIPIKYKTSGQLLFYQNNIKQIISYQDIRQLVGNAIPIVSHLCLSSTFNLLGKAVSPDSEVNVTKKGVKLGVKGFVTLKNNNRKGVLLYD